MRAQTAGEWTIYNTASGEAVQFSSFIGAEMVGDAKVITAPIEGGSFVAYNKTVSPFELSVNGAIKGDSSVLSDALNTLAQMRENTDLYNIVTPDKVYRSMNMIKLEYSRDTDSGTDLILFSARFMEVKEIQSLYSSARIPRRQSRGRQQAPEESVAHMIGRWVGGS